MKDFDWDEFDKKFNIKKPRFGEFILSMKIINSED